jgi:hypothetical protein
MSATERFEFDSIANQVGVSQTARAVYEKNKSQIRCPRPTASWQRFLITTIRSAGGHMFD